VHVCVISLVTDDDAAQAGSRRRWLMTVVTPSPRMVTP
jgi:hypothetical protein